MLLLMSQPIPWVLRENATLTQLVKIFPALILLLACRLFNDAVNNLALKDRMVSAWLIRKDVEGRSRGLIWSGPNISKFAWRDSENLSPNIRTPSRDLNPIPLEYRAGIPTTWPRRSVPDILLCLQKFVTGLYLSQLNTIRSFIS